MVKLELIRTLMSKDGDKPPGTVIEVSKEEAARLISGLAAKPIDESATEKGEPTLKEIIAAARKAYEDGEVTSQGKPEVQAISDILGVKITGEQRDGAWEVIKDHLQDG